MQYNAKMKLTDPIQNVLNWVRAENPVRLEQLDKLVVMGDVDSVLIDATSVLNAGINVHRRF